MCNVYFRFPVKPGIIRDKWNNFLVENNQDPKKVTKYSVVCSKHFTESCFIMTHRKKLLHKNVVPSIIISRIKHVRLQLLN